MISIVGGVYSEKCIYPEWHQLFGSGGRAAAALCTLSDDVELFTYIGQKSIKDIEAISASFRYKLKSVIVDNTVSFSYFHGLSVPQIYPQSYRFLNHDSIELNSENILRFGFIEGDAKVKGERVVYDPQSNFDPVHFHINGSSARHLSLVLNWNEGRLLSGKDDPYKIVSELIANGDVDAVILKMGPIGTLVRTKKYKKILPCLKTKTVWPIGSGDIFSAVYAHFWAEKKSDPFIAADLALKATAYYCNWSVLPIPSDFHEAVLSFTKPLKLNDNFDKKINKKVYLAGPFFTISQRWLVEEIRRELVNQGLEVFSPLHDVGYGAAEDIAIKDIDGLEESHMVFAVLDGLDAGTLFEVGYAVSKGMPVIGLVQNEKVEDMKMIEGTECKIEKDLVTAIYKAAWMAREI